MEDDFMPSPLGGEEEKNSNTTREDKPRKKLKLEKSVDEKNRRFLQEEESRKIIRSPIDCTFRYYKSKHGIEKYGCNISIKYFKACIKSSTRNLKKEPWDIYIIYSRASSLCSLLSLELSLHIETGVNSEVKKEDLDEYIKQVKKDNDKLRKLQDKYKNSILKETIRGFQIIITFFKKEIGKTFDKKEVKERKKSGSFSRERSEKERKSEEREIHKKNKHFLREEFEKIAKSRKTGDLISEYDTEKASNKKYHVCEEVRGRLNFYIDNATEELEEEPKNLHMIYRRASMLFNLLCLEFLSHIKAGINSKIKKEEFYKYIKQIKKDNDKLRRLQKKYEDSILEETIKDFQKGITFFEKEIEEVFGKKETKERRKSSSFSGEKGGGSKFKAPKKQGPKGSKKKKEEKKEEEEKGEFQKKERLRREEKKKKKKEKGGRSR